MAFPEEAAQVQEDGSARTTLDDLALRGMLTGRPEGGSWTAVHRGVVARIRFGQAQTEIRLGLSKNPVVQADGSIVLETAFPRDQIVLPPVPRPGGIDAVRAALLCAIDLSRAPKAEAAVRLLEAAAALALGAAGATRGILRTGGRWHVETDDGTRIPLVRGAAAGRADASDLAIPAAVLHRIPWCPPDLRRGDGHILETTAHARLAAAETVAQIAPLYGLDPDPWIS